jgi:hypothetical protein
MDSPRLELILDQNDEVLFPGETLSGSYAVTGLERESLRAVEVSVLWQTVGKGDENLGVHYFWRRESREGADDIATGTWSVVLPSSPLSYHGVLFRIVWLARLRVFVRGKDFSEEHEFQLGDLPRAVRSEAIKESNKPIAAEILGSSKE